MTTGRKYLFLLINTPNNMRATTFLNNGYFSSNSWTNEPHLELTGLTRKLCTFIWYSWICMQVRESSRSHCFIGVRRITWNTLNLSLILYHRYVFHRKETHADLHIRLYYCRKYVSNKHVIVNIYVSYQYYVILYLDIHVLVLLDVLVTVADATSILFGYNEYN